MKKESLIERAYQLGATALRETDFRGSLVPGAVIALIYTGIKHRESILRGIENANILMMDFNSGLDSSTFEPKRPK